MSIKRKYDKRGIDQFGFSKEDVMDEAIIDAIALDGNTEKAKRLAEDYGDGEETIKIFGKAGVKTNGAVVSTTSQHYFQEGGTTPSNRENQQEVDKKKVWENFYKYHRVENIDRPRLTPEEREYTREQLKKIKKRDISDDELAESIKKFHKFCRFDD